MMPNSGQLTVTTPSDTEIVMTRDFAAPRHLVWRAMVEPDLLRRWMFTPQGWAMTVCECDVRVGGAFHWAWAGPDGKTALTITGIYREVKHPERIVHTERMAMGEPPPGSNCPEGELGELLATLTLHETTGKTTLRMLLAFDTKEARDGALQSGMEHGVAAGYNQLDEMFKTM